MKLSKAITKYGDIYHMDVMGVVADDIVMLPVISNPIKIDMSVCIESGILCEFWNNETHDEKRIAQLGGMPVTNKEGDCYYRIWNEDKQIDSRFNYAHCHPRMNGHTHASPDGFKSQPLPDGFIINYWGREGQECTTGDYEKLGWHDVIMFTVAGLREGYTL